MHAQFPHRFLETLVALEEIEYVSKNQIQALT